AASYRSSVSLSFDRPRTRFSVGGGFQKLDYVEATDLDESSWFATVDVSRRMTPRLEVFLAYWNRQSDYDAIPGRKETHQAIEAGVDWNVGKSTFVTLGYRHSEVDSFVIINS